MKKIKSELYLLLLLAVSLSACTYSTYLGLTVNEPMLKEAGERQGTLYIGANHLEVQGAYAATKHIGLQADVWKGYDRRYSVEFMPGYYYASPTGFCTGVYAGGGMANTSGYKEINYSTLFARYSDRYINQVRYTTLLLQPSVGYRHKNFEVSFATRFAYVRFSQFKTWYYQMNLNEDQDYKLIESFQTGHASALLFTPAINCSMGLEHVRVFIGTSVTWSMIGLFDDDIGGRNLGAPYLFSSGVKLDLPAPRKYKSNNKVTF